MSFAEFFGAVYPATTDVRTDRSETVSVPSFAEFFGAVFPAVEMVVDRFEQLSPIEGAVTSAQETQECDTDQ